MEYPQSMKSFLHFWQFDQLPRIGAGQSSYLESNVFFQKVPAGDNRDRNSGRASPLIRKIASDLDKRTIPLLRYTFIVALISATASVIPIKLATADDARIAPDFSCPRPAPQDGLAELICENPAMSKAEMSFEQAYYALRQMVGPTGWHDLKVEAVQLDTDLRSSCGIPLAGASDQAMPPNATLCYISKSAQEKSQWVAKLPQNAQQEAERPIEEHIKLQQRLTDLGFLPSGGTADGVYGESTRQAISTWQRVNHRPAVDGFLSDEDTNVLSTLVGISKTPPLQGTPVTKLSTDAQNSPTIPPAGEPNFVPATKLYPNSSGPETQANRDPSVSSPGATSMSVDDFLASGDSINGQQVSVHGVAGCLGDLRKCHVIDIDTQHSIFIDVSSLTVNDRKRLLQCSIEQTISCVAVVKGSVIKLTITNEQGVDDIQFGIGVDTIAFSNGT